jgi:hypothetical protein
MAKLLMNCRSSMLDWLHVQAVERGAGTDGQKITYTVIKHRLGDLFYRLV